MPRGIGASTGVNDSVRRAAGLLDLRARAGARRPCTATGRPSPRCRAGAASAAPAGAGGAAGRDDHDVVGLDQPGGDQRRERQDRRDRVAAGVGDPRRGGDRGALAGQLGQAVGPGAGVRRRRSTARRRRRRSAGGRRRGRRLRTDSGSCGGQRAGRAVRQGEEDQVGVGRASGRRLGEGQVGQRAQVRVDVARPVGPALPCAVTATTIQLGMRRRAGAAAPRPAYPLAPATATRYSHAHNYAVCRNFMQRRGVPRC